MDAAEEAYACRSLAAKLFGVPDPGCVVFCMNATHALNLAIKSIAGPGDRVVISGYEHNSVLRPLTAIGAKITVAASPLFRQEDSLAAFRRELREDTKLAVVNHVSNVFGFVQPLKEIAQLCRIRGIGGCFPVRGGIAFKHHGAGRRFYRHTRSQRALRAAGHRLASLRSTGQPAAGRGKRQRIPQPLDAGPASGSAGSGHAEYARHRRAAPRPSLFGKNFDGGNPDERMRTRS